MEALELEQTIRQEKEDEGITQKDMVLTQFGFIGYVLVCSKKLGLPDDSDGKNGFNHMWRVLGHLLGIPNRYTNFRLHRAY